MALPLFLSEAINRVCAPLGTHPPIIMPAAAIHAHLQNTPDSRLLDIATDYEAIRALRFAHATPAVAPQKPVYVATAGAPCSGKSTELERELAYGGNGTPDARYATAVLTDPDRWVMEYMNHTYRPLVSGLQIAEKGIVKAMQNAYDSARGGSNAIAGMLLNEAVLKHCSIVHGTTLTGPHTAGMLKSLGDAGYERRLLLCAAPDMVREAARDKRLNQEGRYQVTDADFVNKAPDFIRNMSTYFDQGDHVVLMWKPELEKNAVRAAEYRHGKLTVLDKDAYASFTAFYAEQKDRLATKGESLPDWATLEAHYANRFTSPVRNR